MTESNSNSGQVSDGSAQTTTEGGIDEDILDVTKNLCRSLGLAFEPQSVKWITWFVTPYYRMPIPSDQCVIDNGDLAFQLAMRGRLETNDWKPLIASSLVYEFDPGIRRRLFLLRPVRFALILLVALSPWIVLRFAFPDVSASIPPFLSLFYIFIELFILNVLFWDFNPSRRKLRLESDRRAASILGRDGFLAVFAKIDEMKMRDIEAMKSERSSLWSHRGLPWPTINERIENLRKR